MEKVKSNKNNFIFHAGTKIQNGKYFSNGGRVLNFTTLGSNFLDNREKIIKMIKKLDWKNGFFRQDIGWRVIDKKWGSLAENLKEKQYNL